MNQSKLLEQDRDLDIAVAKSRRDKRWRNKRISWPELTERLSRTHRTHEALKDYLRMTKDKQDDIKDVGGFVGGYLTDGIRKNGQVKHRQLLTLDIDLASPEFWDDFTLAYNNAAVVYSTHKHQPDQPRLRLVLPLDRPVTEEEYEPIARRVASVLGIDQFDHTTYQPTRLMYWPSTAKDADYYYQSQGGPRLDVDRILASYTDWKDSSGWPVGSTENEHVKRAAKKAGDPLDKPGIIGAFCRTHSIDAAITHYLDAVYQPTQDPDRWSYAAGSTAGGLVVYDDKFAFSHHGTDPTSGQLCNAFDLVRLHMFGPEDDGQEDTPVNKRPSYGKMVALALKDEHVKLTIGQERLADSRADFTQEDGDEPGENTDWMKELEMTHTGQYRRTIENIVLILENDPRLKGKMQRNTFTDKEVIRGQVPWRKVTRATPYFTDKDIVGIRHYLERVYEIDHKQKTLEAIEVVLGKHSHHPVQDFLDGLTWDGEERLDTLLIDYLGAEDTPYTRAVTRKTLTAAVARIRRPGAKFDYVLTLVGKQGAGKSTLISRLGGEWYCENLTTVQGKEAAEQLRGVWILEMGELAGLKKAEQEIIKNFISRQEDSYRPAYGIKKETYPRQCIFIGTTNNEDFLRDATGNRRFWPVAISDDLSIGQRIHAELTKDLVAQIWAEAQTRYQEGETLYLDLETEAAAREIQEQHRERDARHDIVKKYLELKLPVGWEDMSLYQRRDFLNGDPLQAEGTETRELVSVAEIWLECLGGQLKELSSHNTKPLHDLMRTMPGWRATRGKRLFSGGYGKRQGYVRIGSKKHDYDC
jgi:predicted P-loop ATPase